MSGRNGSGGGTPWVWPAANCGMNAMSAATTATAGSHPQAAIRWQPVVFFDLDPK